MQEKNKTKRVFYDLELIFCKKCQHIESVFRRRNLLVNKRSKQKEEDSSHLPHVLFDIISIYKTVS